MIILVKIQFVLLKFVKLHKLNLIYVFILNYSEFKFVFVSA